MTKIDKVMGLVPVTDEFGQAKLVMRPIAPKKKGKKKAKTLDPIHANPDQASQMLKQALEDVERYDLEIQEIQDTRRERLEELKSNGFDLKAFNELRKIRKMETHLRIEHEAILDTYKSAIGII